MSRLLAFDPSLRCTGYVYCDIASPYTLREAGAISTDAQVKSDDWALRKMHDEARRGTELGEAVYSLIMRLCPDAIALESPLGAQDAAAAWSLARANQAVALAIRLAWQYDGARPIWVSPYAARAAATGRKTAPKDSDGKDLVRAGVRRFWGPVECDDVIGALATAREQEAAYDAAAVAMVALRLPALRAIAAGDAGRTVVTYEELEAERAETDQS